MSQTNDQLIEQYLAGQMSSAEEEAFLQRVQTEPELGEQLKLEKNMRAALDDADWAFTENSDHDEVKAYAEAFASDNAQALKESINKASEAYHAKEQKTERPKARRLWIYSVAAAAVLIISFMIIKPKPMEPGLLYSEYLQKTELPDLTTRSADDNAAELLRAQALFNNQEYKNAVTAFQKLLVQMPSRSELYINMAVAQIELDQFDEAIGTLDQLIGSNLLDAQKGYWYQSLVYLKAGEPERCEALLETIIDNRYYNHLLAAQLLKKL